MSHFIIGLAKHYPKQTAMGRAGTTYDEGRSMWILAKDGKPLVLSSDPEFSNPVTKKHDIETGEDQKGE